MQVLSRKSYQPQSVIANKDILFFKTSDGFVKLALKDAFPYLLGAVRDDVLIVEQQIKALKKELRQIKIKKNEREELIRETWGQVPVSNFINDRVKNQ